MTSLVIFSKNGGDPQTKTYFSYQKENFIKKLRSIESVAAAINQSLIDHSPDVWLNKNFFNYEEMKGQILRSISVITVPKIDLSIKNSKNVHILYIEW